MFKVEKWTHGHLCRILLWLLVGLGVLLRLAQYLYNRSLWVDEAALALNIRNRSFSELFYPLDYAQAAPIGFLIVEKLLYQTLGHSEYVLRLFPFLCGVIALFLLRKVAVDFLGEQAALISLGLFAVSSRLVYYASELKPYSSDVCIALLLYALTTSIRSKRFTIPRMALFGIVGGIAICFSYPAVFVLAGIGLSLTLFHLSRKEWAKVGYLSIPCGLWSAAFLVCYFLSIAVQTRDEAFYTYWSHSFMPIFPTSFSDPDWFVETFFGVLNPAGLILPGLAAFVFLVGCVSMFQRERTRLSLLLSPILLTLVASGLHKYPFADRLLLFIVPSLLLVVAEGAIYVREKTRSASAMIGLILIGLLCLRPFLAAGHRLFSPYTNEEIKPVLAYVKAHWQDGDILYLAPGARLAFEFYSEDYGFREGDYIFGTATGEQWSRDAEELGKLRGRDRVWIVFSHLHWESGINEEIMLLYHLDGIGSRLDSFRAPNAATYLYDLSTTVHSLCEGNGVRAAIRSPAAR